MQIKRTFFENYMFVGGEIAKKTLPLQSYGGNIYTHTILQKQM